MHTKCGTNVVSAEQSRDRKGTVLECWRVSFQLLGSPHDHGKQFHLYASALTSVL